jgi:hypothetical protein
MHLALQVLLNHLEGIMNPDLLPSSGQPRPLQRLPGLGLALPSSANKSEWEALIGSLHEVDEPELFGLPRNIDKVVQQAASGRVLTLLRQLGVGKVGSGG